jgi:hypothetical protein
MHHQIGPVIIVIIILVSLATLVLEVHILRFIDDIVDRQIDHDGTETLD